MNYTEWSHRCCLLPFDLQCWLEKIWHQRQSFLPDKGPYFKNLCIYRSETTCSWSKQVRVSCGWVGVCETLQRRAGCRTGPPTLVHTTAPAPAYCTGDRTGTPCIIVRRTARRGAGLETPATFGQLKRQLGPAGTHTGAFKLSCCCMSGTQNCTSCLPDRKSYIFVCHIARLTFESVKHKTRQVDDY